MRNRRDNTLPVVVMVFVAFGVGKALCGPRLAAIFVGLPVLGALSAAWAAWGDEWWNGPRPKDTRRR